MPFGLEGLGGSGGIGDVVNAGLNFASAEYFRDKSSDEATAARNWATDMRGSAYQASVADLKAAGLNPMLAYMHGPTAVPGAAMAGATPSPDLSGALTHSAEQRVLQAQADKVVAETAEIKARTPTYGVQMDKWRQDIAQGQAAVQELLTRSQSNVASAGQHVAQTEVLQAQLPHIEAMIRQADSMTRMNDAQVAQVAAQIGKTVAETKSILQQVSANMPEMQRMLAQLDVAIKQPKAAAGIVETPIHNSMFGKLAALIRVFNPLVGIVGGN